VALKIASSLNNHVELFRICSILSELSFKEGRFNDAHAHIERAKSHAVNDPYLLARASWLQAEFWEQQHMFQEAKSEASHVLDVFEKLGAATFAVQVRQFLEKIDRKIKEIDDGELPKSMVLVVCINLVFGEAHRVRMMA
jgi:hypothetical protein